MSKVILLVFCIIAITLADTSFDKVKEIVGKDQCAFSKMQIIKPKIQHQMQQIKSNPTDLKAKAELLILIEEVKKVYEQCKVHEKIQPAVGDIIQASGIAFLLASNCFKDVGAVLLIGDSIIQDPSSITADAIILIFLYLLGRQGYADCQQFLHFIL